MAFNGNLIRFVWIANKRLSAIKNDKAVLKNNVLAIKRYEALLSAVK